MKNKGAFLKGSILTGETGPELIVNIDKSLVAHPKHYTNHPSGIECIEITKHMNFCLGNAIKYIWRAGLKNDAIEDLEKAKKYIEFEIERIKK